MTNFKYQEQFAEELAEAWLNEKREHVRTTIRNLKNKAQAAYICGSVAMLLATGTNNIAGDFLRFMHPNQR